MKSIYDKINEATNIVELASEFLDLKKKGNNYVALCPFHEEKTPSFSISPERNIAYCFGCNTGGAPIAFLSKIKNISYNEAAAELAKRAGIEFHIKKKYHIDPKILELFSKTADFYNQVLLKFNEGATAFEYLNKRKISEEDITKFKLGYSPTRDALLKYLNANNIDLNLAEKFKIIRKDKNDKLYDFFVGRVIFPILNEDGDIISFSGREITGKSQAKYLGSENSEIFEKSQILYNINNLKNNEPIYIVEGFFDCIAMAKAGFNNTVAQMGTALTSLHLKSLSKKSKEVVLLYDTDKAGYNAVISSSKLLLRENFNVSIVILKDPEDENKKIDPDDFYRIYGKEKLSEYINNNKIDAYEFFYNHYEKSLDKEDNKSLLEFTKNIKEFLTDANDVIIKKYEKRVENILGYNISLRLSTKEKSKYLDRIREQTPEDFQEVKKPEKIDPILKEESYILDLEPIMFVDIIKSDDRTRKYNEYNDTELDGNLSNTARNYFIILGEVLKLSNHYLTYDEFDFSKEKYHKLTEPYGVDDFDLSKFYAKIKRELEKVDTIRVSTKQIIRVFNELKPIFDNMKIIIDEMKNINQNSEKGIKEWNKKVDERKKMFKEYNNKKKNIMRNK